jgi:hypothetical protein
VVFLSLYHVLPNFAEVTATVTQLARDVDVTSWYPAASATLFGSVLYILSFRSFSKKDY